MEPIDNTRIQMETLWALPLGLLYLLFDLEIIFIYPLATGITNISTLGFIYSIMF